MRIPYTQPSENRLLSITWEILIIIHLRIPYLSLNQGFPVITWEPPIITYLRIHYYHPPPIIIHLRISYYHPAEKPLLSLTWDSPIIMHLRIPYYHSPEDSLLSPSWESPIITHLCHSPCPPSLVDMYSCSKRYLQNTWLHFYKGSGNIHRFLPKCSNCYTFILNVQTIIITY